MFFMGLILSAHKVVKFLQNQFIMMFPGDLQHFKAKCDKDNERE